MRSRIPSHALQTNCPIMVTEREWGVLAVAQNGSEIVLPLAVGSREVGSGDGKSAQRSVSGSARRKNADQHAHVSP